MDIAGSLNNQALDKPEFEAIDIGTNTGITFPYYEFYVSVGPLDPMPPFLKKVYDVGISVWGSENLPSDWKNFLVEVCAIRESKGIKSPFSPFSGAMLMIEENPELEMEITKILNKEVIIFEEIILDADAMKSIFNFFLKRDDLKSELKSKLVDFVYYNSASWVDTYEIKKFIEKINLKNGVIVDIGCGAGGSTNDLTNTNKVVGLDRQYYPSRFKENWNADGNLFLQAEAEKIPLAGNSVDMVTMTSVVGHLDVNTLQIILEEVNRVLKVGGHFVVGPQNSDSFNMYRYFKKNDNQELVEIFSEN